MDDNSVMGDNDGEHVHSGNHLLHIRDEVQHAFERFVAAQAAGNHYHQPHAHVDPRVPRRQTVREMSAPLNIDQPWCIVLPPNEIFELRSGLVHHLPKFHGLSNENPVNHLKEFLVVVTTMKTDTEHEEALKLKAFPFTLHEQAKHWI